VPAGRLHDREATAVDGDAVTHDGSGANLVRRNDEFPRLRPELEGHDLPGFFNNPGEHGSLG
jgi:hypothetical protein